MVGYFYYFQFADAEASLPLAILRHLHNSKCTRTKKIHHVSNTMIMVVFRNGVEIMYFKNYFLIILIC